MAYDRLLCAGLYFFVFKSYHNAQNYPSAVGKGQALLQF
jgi:hypothetical protein